MATDFVFVRANNKKPVREGAAVSAMPTALPGTGVVAGYFSYARPDVVLNPSGNQAQAALLAGRFENIGYYYDQSGVPPNQNPISPTF